MILSLAVIIIVVSGFVRYKEELSEIGNNLLASLRSVLPQSFSKNEKGSASSAKESDSEFTIIFEDSKGPEEPQNNPYFMVKEPPVFNLEKAQERIDDISEKIDVLGADMEELRREKGFPDEPPEEEMQKEELEKQEEEKDKNEEPEEDEEIEEIEDQEEFTPPELSEPVCAIPSLKIPKRNLVIFNEIAWMGTSISANDEWIELKNLTNDKVNMDGWQMIDKAGKQMAIFKKKDEIPSLGLFLLERTNDQTVPGVTADKIFVGGLNDTNEALFLFNQNCELEDSIEADSSWPAGSKAEKRSMERLSDLSWQTYSGPSQNNIFGTPKIENKADFGHFSTAVESSPKILITEVQIEGDKAGHDFIELFNPSSRAVNISGYQLKKRNKPGVESSIRVFPQGSEIKAENYFLWASSEAGYDDLINSDVSSSGYLIENNSIALFDKSNNIVDKLAWGLENINPFVEADAFPENPGKNQSIERKKDLAGVFIDTDDNSQDFFLQQNPNPKNVILDKTPPSPPIIISHSNNQWLNLKTIDLFGIAEPESFVSLLVGSDSFSTPSNQDGLWQFIVSLTEGENKLVLTSQDKAGNKSESANSSLFLDTNPPQVSFEQITDFQSTIIFSISWQAIDPVDNVTSSGLDGFSILYSVTPSDLDGINLRYQDKEIGWVDWKQDDLKNVKENSINLLGKDGYSYAFFIKAKDRAGNESGKAEALTRISVFKNISITEIQIEGDNVNQDFIELYNPNPYDVFLGSYQESYLRLVKRTKTSAGDTTIKSWYRDSETKIGPKRYLLWASSKDISFPAIIGADCWTSQYLSLDNGIALRLDGEDNGNIIDAVGWGSFQNVLFESKAFQLNPSLKQSLSRKWDTANDAFQDTDNNIEDFWFQSPTPKLQNP